MNPSAIFFFVNEFYFSCLILCKFVLCSSVGIVCAQIPRVEKIYHILICSVNLDHSTVQDSIMLQC